MLEMRGMTWDHDRGKCPLAEASRLFLEKHGVKIVWDARSLNDFELFPLDQLAAKYDFIMIDHPHIGAAHKNNILLPLEKYLPSSYLEEQKNGSVGNSYESYTWENHQYALPIDAAAQVCAYRKDLLEKNNLDVPATWDDVYKLAELHKGRMLIPFVPIHAYSSFFTVSSQITGKPFWSNGEDLDEDAGSEALECLSKIVGLSNETSVDMDPIQVLELMSSTDEILYCPLIYGYSNYSRQGFRKYVVRFKDIPVLDDLPNGSMIGGVGLAISSNCKHLKEAVDFVMMVASPKYQKRILFDAGGQPGHMEAWTDEHVNSLSYDFFKNTLNTMRYSSMRPRFAGYVDFQADAGARIREFVISKNKNRKSFIRELNELINHYRLKGEK